LSLLLPLAWAHGHVTGIVANKKYYMGYTPNIQYMNPKPKLSAWYGGGYGQGGISGDKYNSVGCSSFAQETVS